LKILHLPQGTSERILLCAGAAYYEDGLVGLRKKSVKGLAEPGKNIDEKPWYKIGDEKARWLLGMEFRGFEECVEDVWGWAMTVKLV
jgi:hypothetical protein